MAKIINHRGVRIVTLEPDETVATHCKEGDILLVEEEDGWWTHFVGPDGETDSYDAPFENYNKALWTAKAAAEFSAE
ncbi:hypothetical protein [Noviherbaspirillum denitrificans]|uniref:Uncharacterized protein n=1 Tax=Noviherbaspirillum denitrificans TaxID=1968433 RepID=A0A254TCL7_9BURK|nr:hypothetical protein [Noviherbaspirillum denitrificans]OWW19917.1 hypothetical protein AYR66_10800 [Noviherbaspirillum denitrificans]